jgi:hypothetical protein
MEFKKGDYVKFGYGKTAVYIVMNTDTNMFLDLKQLVDSDGLKIDGICFNKLLNECKNLRTLSIEEEIELFLK